MDGDTRISELPINDVQKMILTLCTKPRTTYEIAAKLKKSYSSINQNMGILKASGYVNKLKKLSGGVIYTLKNNIKP